jgi:hypothetical protein
LGALNAEEEELSNEQPGWAGHLKPLRGSLEESDWDAFDEPTSLEKAALKKLPVSAFQR